MKVIISLCLSLLLFPAASLAKQTTIIVTLPPLSGLVSMLLPHTPSQCLLSAGADPHHFQPSPRQVDMLNQGHILLRASQDDRGWPIRPQQSKVFDLWSKESHAWLRFDLVAQALPKLANKLIQAFPQQKSDINTNLKLALLQVKTMQAQWSSTLQRITQRGVFMQHPAWQGILEAQNVPVWAVLESNKHGHEHGPHHLEHALETFNAHPSSLLLGSKRHSNRSLAWLQQHQKGAPTIIKLDALGSCNQPWDDLMQANLDILKQHL